VGKWGEGEIRSEKLTEGGDEGRGERMERVNWGWFREMQGMVREEDDTGERKRGSCREGRKGNEGGGGTGGGGGGVGLG